MSILSILSEGVHFPDGGSWTASTMSWAFWELSDEPSVLKDLEPGVESAGLAHRLVRLVAFAARELRELLPTDPAEDPVFNAGIYLRLFYRFDKTTLYLLGGAAFVDTYDNTSGGDEISESGVSYGVGLELFGNKNASVILEFLKLVDTDQTEMDSIGLGYRHYF